MSAGYSASTSAMRKRQTPIKQKTHIWAVYHIEGTPAKFMDFIYDPSDEQTAIARAWAVDGAAAGLRVDNDDQ